jgi:hypothetical protein
MVIGRATTLYQSGERGGMRVCRPMATNGRGAPTGVGAHLALTRPWRAWAASTGD